MNTLFIRDEQGNMRVVHDWHRGDTPHLMGHADCQALAARIRAAYPNVCHGLELCYYYTGDNYRASQNTRINDEFDHLPRFGRFLSGGAAEPDLPQPRPGLQRTAPFARTRDEIQRQIQAERSGAPLVCGCGWSGQLSEAADYESDSWGIDWTCPSCGAERFYAARSQPPVSAEH